MLLALALTSAPCAALAQGQTEGTDWLGYPLPKAETFGNEPADNVDPFEDFSVPNAIELKGSRPKSDSTNVAPAATNLSPNVDRLEAPESLALPNQTRQVRIDDLRPLTLTQSVEIMEVNNPFLKAIAMQVEEAKSNLRAQIALWYPTINLSTRAFPGRNWGTNYQNFGRSVASESTANKNAQKQQEQQDNLENGTANNTQLDRYGEWWGTTQTYGADASLNLSWTLINPRRVPNIAAARDQYEKAKNQYLITLRDLRLQTAQSYFSLQVVDAQVEVGKTSVQAATVNLRDSRARLQAGVATKLDVLEAETQLSREQYRLTNFLAEQQTNQRELARLLNLPQDVTPTAADTSQVLGVWQPSLQESIVAAYSFREELNNLILDISIANSQANSALAGIQPSLTINGTSTWSKQFGESGSRSHSHDVNLGMVRENTDQQVFMGLTWTLFDGGAAAAQSRQQKQVAKQQTYRFANERNQIRKNVEEAFFKLQAETRNLITQSREVLSSREAYRLSVLRYQAGVGTQRNVIDNQRDVTQAEVDYARSVGDYNRALAQLRRRTGLDQVARCLPPDLPADPPPKSALTDVPVLSTPLNSPCQVSAATVEPPAD